MEGNMSGKITKQPGQRAALTLSDIESLRRKGYNQSQIADMYGVSRQAVSWHKHTYGGSLTPRQIVNKAWPWKTTNLHGKAVAYQRLRDHGEFMANGFKDMSDEKKRRLVRWWEFLRDNDVVLEFDPNLPPEPGVAPHGGFAYRPRKLSDDDLIIRANEYTNLTEEGDMIWCWPPDDVFDHHR
ncbi:hypothetical protein MAIC_42690 [Mycolicibacterium aichiense]|uniref:Immunity repressor n=2 Tax=Mycolicibacterium aichiense TaxID=1799 RepID=A0AAD1ME09_9MYCO|nr:immunity repressor [Mycobacterium phage Herbertwm]BBX09466.1 hypothetical protein MAIC_42690 [Mycolicibacterium aichiense]